MNKKYQNKLHAKDIFNFFSSLELSITENFVLKMRREEGGVEMYF